MASRRPEERGTSSLEIVWVRLNASDTTIEGALRTVQSMRNGNASHRQVPARQVKALPGKNGSPDEQPEEATLFDPPEEPVDVEAAGGEGTPPPSPPATPRPQRKQSRLPKGIPDLDFNSPTPTFRAFVAGKNPQDQFDWYLLVAYWLKKYKQIEEIGLPHIVSAKQYIGADWDNLPEDAGQPFRDGRRQAHGIFAKGSKNGLSVITKNGEDRVDRRDKKE